MYAVPGRVGISNLSFSTSYPIVTWRPSWYPNVEHSRVSCDAFSCHIDRAQPQRFATPVLYCRQTMYEFSETQPSPCFLVMAHTFPMSEAKALLA